MFDPHMPTAHHMTFDDLCEGVEEYETLPELHVQPTRDPRPAETEADSDAIDAEILAGLVSP